MGFRVRVRVGVRVDVILMLPIKQNDEFVKAVRPVVCAGPRGVLSPSSDMWNPAEATRMLVSKMEALPSEEDNPPRDTYEPSDLLGWGWS